MDWLFDLTGLLVGWDAKGLLVFLLIFILTADYVKNRRSSRFPPGPRAIPIVGNMFTLDHSRTHESLTQVDLNQPRLTCTCSDSLGSLPHLSHLFPAGRDARKRVQSANGPDMDGGAQQF